MTPGLASEQAAEWCDRVWGQRPGFFFFAFGVFGHFNAAERYKFSRWQERSGRWPDDRDRFLVEALERAKRDDVYVGPYLRSNASRKKGNALASNVLYSDLDELREENRGFESALIGPSGLLVESGHGLHPYLLLPEELEPQELERLNRHLAHSLGADAGWAENKVLRLPGTLNHKGRARGGVAAPVALIDFKRAPKDWTPNELVELLGPPPPDVSSNGGATIKPAMPTTVPAHLLARLTEEPADRSTQMYAFVGACLEAGLSDAETLAIAFDHKPTREKYAPETEGAVDRRQVEIERAIRKIRASGVSTRIRTTPGEGLLSLPSLSSQAWPEPLGEAAYHGVTGEFVRLVEPHTEADPAAILVQFLVAASNMIGRGPFFTAAAKRHYANICANIVGKTAKGRKGSSLTPTVVVVQIVDQDWENDRRQSGLSSGEGLIYAVRDPLVKSEDGEEKVVDEGVLDKRLLVVEEEFASVLKTMQRQGNILSTTLRQAFDDGRLRTLTRQSPLKATGAHISVIGHITVEELRRELTETDAAAGFANRFLWVLAERSKLLPDGGAFHRENLAPLVNRLNAAATFARKRGDIELERNSDARALWHDVYAELSRDVPGLLGAVTARAEALTMRLALVYAVLDSEAAIKREHLEAGLEVWRYCRDSAAVIWGARTGDAYADRIEEELERRGKLTRTEVRDLFGRHAPLARTEAAIALLVDLDRIELASEETGGRPVQVLRPKRQKRPKV